MASSGFKLNFETRRADNSGGFLQILFFAEDILVESDVNEVVFEFACFLVVCADYNAEK